MSRSRNVLVPLFVFGLLFDFSTAMALAQSAPPAPRSTITQTTPTETLHTGTELVVIDVVVQNRDGHAVHGLTRDNFVLTEQKTPQTIRNFEEHTPAVQMPKPVMPPMPPGVFTDYTPVTPGSTLNVLLLDRLNTPMQDQNFLRQQLLDFVKKGKPGEQVAIFELGSRVFMLQGFTTDQAILRKALDHKMVASGSPLLNDMVGGGTGPDSLAQSADSLGQPDVEMMALLAQVDNDVKTFQATARAETTLDAFNSIGHYLSNFPGRKNVLWFSGSFPLSIEPNPTVNNDLSAMEDVNDEIRETTNLLTRAQVAVYPIDARGLMIAPALQASDNSAAISSRTQLAASLHEFHEDQIAEHATMEKMAGETGGKAFFNTNGLSAAAAEAMDAGSNYYTLTYTPSDHDWNGRFRDIKVKLAGPPADGLLRLTYRQGYYADNPNHLAKHDELATQSTLSATADANHAVEAYIRTAISHGAPTPDDILFKVQAVPLTGKDVNNIEAANRVDLVKMKAPYRTYAVDYLALPKEFTLTPGSDGRRKGAIEFTTYVFNADGTILNVADKIVRLDLAADAYKRFMSTPVRLHLLVSAPAKQESYMRILVRDMPNNRFGVVEIPTAQVRQLPTFESQMNPGNAARPVTGVTQAPPATKQ